MLVRPGKSLHPRRDPKSSETPPLRLLEYNSETSATRSSLLSNPIVPYRVHRRHPFVAHSPHSLYTLDAHALSAVPHLPKMECVARQTSQSAIPLILLITRDPRAAVSLPTKYVAHMVQKRHGHAPLSSHQNTQPKLPKLKPKPDKAPPQYLCMAQNP